eukprot:scaffold113107_cov35-Tisochrysis_lutea.AAC.5
MKANDLGSGGVRSARLHMFTCAVDPRQEAKKPRPSYSYESMNDYSVGYGGYVAVSSGERIVQGARVETPIYETSNDKTAFATHPHPHKGCESHKRAFYE